MPSRRERRRGDHGGIRRQWNREPFSEEKERDDRVAVLPHEPYEMRRHIAAVCRRHSIPAAPCLVASCSSLTSARRILWLSSRKCAFALGSARDRLLQVSSPARRPTPRIRMKHTFAQRRYSSVAFCLILL